MADNSDIQDKLSDQLNGDAVHIRKTEDPDGGSTEFQNVYDTARALQIVDARAERQGGVRRARLRFR